MQIAIYVTAHSTHILTYRVVGERYPGREELAAVGDGAVALLLLGRAVRAVGRDHRYAWHPAPGFCNDNVWF